jgi:hypothetical protein
MTSAREGGYMPRTATTRSIEGASESIRLCFYRVGILTLAFRSLPTNGHDRRVPSDVFAATYRFSQTRGKV